MYSVIWTPQAAGTPPNYRQVPLLAKPGDVLMVHIWEPPDRRSGSPVAVLLHGIGMHGVPYGAIAGHFTSRGYVLVVPDLRGHGQSSGQRGHLTDVDVLRTDLLRVLDYVAEQYPGSPVVLMGESMGGLLAATLAVDLQSRLVALSLFAPAFQVHRSRFMAPLSLKRLMTQGKVPIITPSHLEPATRDPQFLEARLKDPLTLQEVAPGYLLRLFWLGQQWPRLAERLRLPVFIGLAEKDWIIDNAAAQRVIERTPHQAKQLVIWPEAHHTVFWDPVAPTLFADWDRWLKEHMRP